MNDVKKAEVTKFEQIINNCGNFIIEFNNERERQSPPQIDEDLIPKFTRKSIMNSTQQKKYHERSRLIFKNGQIIWTDNPNELISDITINGIGKSIKLVASIEYYTKIICDTMHDFISDRYQELNTNLRNKYLFFKIVLIGNFIRGYLACQDPGLINTTIKVFKTVIKLCKVKDRQIVLTNNGNYIAEQIMAIKMGTSMPNIGYINRIYER